MSDLLYRLMVTIPLATAYSAASKREVMFKQLAQRGISGEAVNKMDSRSIQRRLEREQRRTLRKLTKGGAK